MLIKTNNPNRLFKIEIKNISFTLLNIQIHSNNATSEKMRVLDEGKSLEINLNNLSDHEKEEIKPLLSDMVNEGMILLGEESKERIEDIELKERSDDEQSVLSFFKDKIPHDDFTALRSAYYLKKRFEEGADRKEIAGLKSDIIKKYSRRGRNISDLCSSGYFEKLIKPLYIEISNDPDFSDDRFLEVYDLIVAEGILTIFVSEGMSSDQVIIETETRIRRNKQYGLNRVHLHGIGRENITTIRMAIVDLKEKYQNIRWFISETANIISVKLLF